MNLNQEIAKKTTEFQLGYIDKLIKNVSRVVGLLDWLLVRPFYLGIVVGVTERELGIKVGTSISVLGTIMYDKETGELRLKNPEYIANTKEDILNYIKSNEQILKGGALLAAAGSLYFLYRLLSTHRGVVACCKANAL